MSENNNRKLSPYPIPAKLFTRQINGSFKLKKKFHKHRLFEKCPNRLQIPLKNIFDAKTFMKGHIAIGFTEDGRYLLTYVSNIKFQLSDTSVCSYQYVLHWWKFDLWNKLQKVYEVELFAKETISNEVHLIVCQDSATDYIVVHASLVNTDSQSNGRMCYVSIVPKYNKKKPEQNQYSVHFKYELLPPHPPFLTTISLKRKNVILLNSGDMLFAILIPEPSSLFSCEPSGKDIQTRLCYCQQRQQDVLANQSNIDVNYDDSTDYISFINQGFNTINDNDSQTSLPDSPFDCMTTVIPCAITTVDGLIQLKNSYEHRCFRHADKGEMSKCDFFVNQAQLDAENFMNTELQKREDISKRFVSLKDYDMQFIEFCTEDDSAIILINALVVLRNTSKPRDDTATNNPEPSSTKFDLFEEQKSMKLVLYTVGYILAWNIFTGEVKVLRELPITERPSNYCKPRNFAPSFSQSTQLRKKWFVPSSKTSSISVLSNHTVLTGKSVQFLFHPEFPVAIVL